MASLLRDLAAHPGVTAGFGAADRLDPYWDGLWANGSTASWVSAELAARQVASGLSVLPYQLRMSMGEALRILRQAKTRGPRLSALAAVDQWRTVTVEQMAAISGWSRLADPESKVLAAAFTVGVLDVGLFSMPMRRGSLADRARLVRPTRSHSFVEVLEPHLSYQEWVSVTGGQAWDFRRQYDRHNLLSTELGLRVAEFCEVGTVLGEKLSTADLLFWSGLGRSGPCPDRRAADLTVVRSDGLRIAVELTASAGADFAGKVRRWAQALAGNSLAASGLVVLFVDAAPPGTDARASARQRSVAEEVRRQVAKVVTEFPGTATDRVASRIAVASWSDWFPGPHQGTDGFVSLDAVRPTGPPGSRWEPVSLLDPFDLEFAPHDPGAMQAVIANAGMLLGVPHWLRSAADAPPLWPLLMADVGFEELPVPPPSRPGRSTGQRAALASGIPGLTTAPDRMRVDIEGWPGAAG